MILVVYGDHPGVGKDTAAAMLAEYGFQRVGFSDSLYQEVSEAYGVSEDILRTRETKEVPTLLLATSRCQDEAFKEVIASLGLSPETPLSPRDVLRYWGTEYRRAQNEDYWVDRVEHKLREGQSKAICLTDCRFVWRKDWELFL